MDYSECNSVTLCAVWQSCRLVDTILDLSKTEVRYQSTRPRLFYSSSYLIRTLLRRCSGQSLQIIELPVMPMLKMCAALLSFLYFPSPVLWPICIQCETMEQANRADARGAKLTKDSKISQWIRLPHAEEFLRILFAIWYAPSNRLVSFILSCISLTNTGF